jgi:alkanesulfonate monooxygenase SsuD/methylene tetrahydromethanopterin reductase-like flavin-dependent oxidoreductase (luciferase family)
MKFSLFLSAQLEPERPRAPQFAELVEQVQLAEELGFTGVFLPHHHIAGVPYLQPMPLLGYLAGKTRRLQLGTSVLLLPLRNPVAIAEEVATLDVMSGGRITLGVGQGYRPEEWDAFGVPHAQRGERFQESIEVIRRLWAGDTVTHRGHFGALDGAALSILPLQPGGPPVWIGAYTERGIQRAAVVGDALIGSSTFDRNALARAHGRFVDVRRSSGRPAPTEFPVLRETSIAPTREAAIAALRSHLAVKLAAYERWARRAMDLERSIANCSIAGTPAEAVRQIGEYEELGVTHLILRVQWPGMPHAEVVRTIRLLGEEVLDGAGQRTGS